MKKISDLIEGDIIWVKCPYYITNPEDGEWRQEKITKVEVGEDMYKGSGRWFRRIYTDNCVTLMYAKAYVDNPEMKISIDDLHTLYNKAKDLHKENKFKWDKIFIFPPSKDFVDDGTRYMGQASMEERKKNFDILQKLIQDFYPEVSKTYLTGSYLENFEEVKNYINSLL